ncbi:MAG: hypothetical protein U0231_21290 [Nitrospiraceae bacterium]
MTKLAEGALQEGDARKVKNYSQQMTDIGASDDCLITTFAIHANGD